MERLTQEEYNKRILEAMEPVAGARPDALRTVLGRAKARNREVLSKRVKK